MNIRVSKAARRTVVLWVAVVVFGGNSRVQAEEADRLWKNLILQGQYAAAAHENEKALRLFQEAMHEAGRFGADDSRVATTLRSLGLVYQAEKRLADAEAAFRRAVAILDKGDVAQNVDFADLNFSLGSVLMEEGKQAEAFPLLAKSLSLYETQQGGGGPRAASVHCLLGETYRARQEWELAEKSLKRCAELREADSGVLNAGFGDALYSLAIVYEKTGKYALAEPRYRLAEKIREKTEGITSPGFAEVLESHAALLQKMGRNEEARREAALATSVRRHQSPRPRTSAP